MFKSKTIGVANYRSKLACDMQIYLFIIFYSRITDLQTNDQTDRYELVRRTPGLGSTHRVWRV